MICLGAVSALPYRLFSRWRRRHSLRSPWTCRGAHAVLLQPDHPAALQPCAAHAPIAQPASRKRRRRRPHRALAPASAANGPVRGFVVTRTGIATKTDTPINETPQSISVVSTEQVKVRNRSTRRCAIPRASTACH